MTELFTYLPSAFQALKTHPLDAHDAVTLFVRKDRLYAVGSVDYYLEGEVFSIQSEVPILIDLPFLIASVYYTERIFVLTLTGELYMLGEITAGDFLTFSSEPQRVPLGQEITLVASSYDVSSLLLLTLEGELYTWDFPGTSLPIPLLVGRQVREAYTSYFYGAAITSDGELYKWGHGGTLFLEQDTVVTNPSKVKLPLGCKVQTASLRAQTALLVTNQGYYYVKRNSDGGTDWTQLSISLPEQDERIVRVFFRNSMRALLTESGEVYMQQGELRSAQTVQQLSRPFVQVAWDNPVAAMVLETVYDAVVVMLLNQEIYTWSPTEGRLLLTVEAMHLWRWWTPRGI